MSKKQSPSICHPRGRSTLAFTMTEMLVVMGIITLLMAALLPAVRGLGNSASRQGAIGTLVGVLDRARMMAISDGLATYVVFAAPVNADGQRLKPGLWGRAYAIYQDHDNINFAPEQRTAWMQLPLGMAFKVSESESLGGNRASSVTSRVPAAADPAFPVAAGALNATGTSRLQLPYWKFDATGAVTEQDPYYLRLLVFPGLIDSGGREVASQTAGGKTANLNQMLLEEITVNPATGRARYTVNPYNMSAPTPTPST